MTPRKAHHKVEIYHHCWQTSTSMSSTRNDLKRVFQCVRYADDIVLLAKSKRASERLLESSTKYLEERLKLTVNREKSGTVSVFAIRNFKFLGFALGRNGKGIYVRVHPKSWKKFKSRLKELSSRKRCQIKPTCRKSKYMQEDGLTTTELHEHEEQHR